MTDITNCSDHIACRPDSNQLGQRFSGFMKRIWVSLKEAHAQRHQRKIDREAFRNLMSLDETSLKDLGISRDDIIWASKLAMHENASKELERVRSLNIANARANTTKNLARRKL